MSDAIGLAEPTALLLQYACDLGMAGIVTKRVDCIVRSKNWLKTKNSTSAIMFNLKANHSEVARPFGWGFHWNLEARHFSDSRQNGDNLFTL